MRILLLIIALIVSPQLFSQSVRTVQHKGKSYFVYPFPMAENSGEIVPYIGKLPDGNYLVYYEHFYRNRFSVWKMKKVRKYTDSTRIAAEFSLVNGKKEGDAWFYSEKGQLNQNGKYQNDEMAGTWYYWYDKKRKKDPLLLSSKTEFVNGVWHGPDSSFRKDGSLQRVLNYRMGMLHGPGIEYFPNGKVLEIIPYYDTLFAEKTGSNFNLVTIITQSDRVPYSISQNDMYLHGTMVSYNNNGKLSFRAEFQYNRLVSLDTVFYYSGMPSLILTKMDPAMPDNESRYLLRSYYQSSKYYPKGNPEEIILFKGTNIQEKTVLSINGDTLAYFTTDRTKLIPDKNGIARVGMNKEFGLKEEFYMHLPSGILFSREYDLSGNIKTDFSNIQYDAQTQIVRYTRNSYSHNGRIRKENQKTMLADTGSSALSILSLQGSLDEIQNQQSNNNTFAYYQLYPEKKIETPFALFLDDKPVTGKVSFISKKKKNKKGLIRQKDGILEIYSDDSRVRLTTIYSGKYTNGIKDSLWIKYSDGMLTEVSRYDNGNRNGTCINYAFRTLNKEEYKNAKDCGVTLHKRKAHYMSSLAEYKKGQKHGDEVYYTYDGNISSFTQYKNGVQHGVAEKYENTGQPMMIASFKEGQPHGKIMYARYRKTYEYNPSTKKSFPRIILTQLTNAQFENGLLNGPFELYNNSQISVRGEFSKQCLTGTWTYYRSSDNGQPMPMSTYQFDINDSVRGNLSFTQMIMPTSPRLSNRTEAHFLNDNNSTSNNSLSPSYLTRYYPNGKKALEGKLDQREPIGVWKIYDENQTLTMIIDYTKAGKEFIRKEGDTLQSYASVEQYYSNGKKRCEGWVVGEETNYDCIARMELPSPEIIYNNYWDPSGKQTLINGNGTLLLYDPMGRKRGEGELIDHLQNGMWKFYNSEGSLFGIGEMINGLEHGKWYEGDLSGLHFEDQTCFDMNDPNVREQLEYGKKVLSITETVYNMGEIEKHTSYELDLNEKEVEKKNRRRRNVIYDF